MQAFPTLHLSIWESLPGQKSYSQVGGGLPLTALIEHIVPPLLKIKESDPVLQTGVSYNHEFCCYTEKACGTVWVQVSTRDR